MFERPPLSSSKCGEADDVPKQDARFPSLCLIRLQGCLGKLCDRRRNGSGAPATAPTIVAWHKSKNGMIRPIYSILTRRQVRMSPNHCSRLFKESTGQSPHRNCIRYMAIEDLATTGAVSTPLLRFPYNPPGLNRLIQRGLSSSKTPTRSLGASPLGFGIGKNTRKFEFEQGRSKHRLRAIKLSTFRCRRSLEMSPA